MLLVALSTNRTVSLHVSSIRVPIHEDFVWKIVAQLVSALDECHCGLVMDEETQKMIPRHILHRDLKPDNGKDPLRFCIDSSLRMRY